ncbi:von Willebrand factor type A [Candidatus Magnetoovum chiemensis]|nr:von Willebrand factor type A [Candidatus Magnetoovum chiemensis]
MASCNQEAAFVINSGSENQTLERLLEDFERANSVDIVMQYRGSVDTMMELQDGSISGDAVWPANSLWLSLGDKNHIVKNSKSIMTSPVVFGIRLDLAKSLDFIGKPVMVKQILQAIEAKKLSFAMTSATQSNSGASAYIGFIYALLGNPEIITKEDLYNPKLKQEIRTLLSGINRSSGSSGWLKELFLNSNYNAMVNYEAVIIETNQELIRQGKEPLYAVYPVDGLVLADSPLGFINRGDTKKEEIFNKLQDYLLSPDVQQKITQLGRRAGIGGGDPKSYDKNIFNSHWGIDVEKVLSPIKLPKAEVIYEALRMYQVEFRKPSFTVYCLDFSGSMAGKGQEQLKQAMAMIIDQKTAAQYILQASADDITVVLAFSNRILAEYEVKGNNEQALNKLLNDIRSLNTKGGTDIYSAAVRAFELMAKQDLNKYIPAVVLMTDGESNTGKDFDDFSGVYKSLKKDIPVFSIMFGDASEDQLKELSDLTKGKIFDGRKDLIKTFREVKGYN